MDDYVDARCSASGVTRTYSSRLVHASCLGSFPEKSISKKILSALPEKGDLCYLNFEDKCLKTQNKGNLIVNKDIAWHKWYISKLEQKREAKKNEDIRKMAEEERQKEQRLQKQDLEDRYIRIWTERKYKEDAARRKEDKAKETDVAKNIEKDRQKKEQVRKMAERSYAEWVKRKDNEQKGRGY